MRIATKKTTGEAGESSMNQVQARAEARPLRTGHRLGEPTRSSLGIGCIPGRDLLHLQSYCSCVRRMRKHRCCCSPELPLAACFLNLAITRSVNLDLSPSEPIVRRHIGDGTVQARREPEITRNPTVVFIAAPVALSPVVELAGLHAQPVDESSGTNQLVIAPRVLYLGRCAQPSIRPAPCPWS